MHNRKNRWLAWKRFTEYHENIPVLKDKKMFPEAVAKLAHYEDLEEQGLLLKLPCKVGDGVYYVYTKCNADGTECYKHCDNCAWFSTGIERVCFDLDMLCGFGDFYFLTKEEAKKALAEMKGK